MVDYPNSSYAIFCIWVIHGLSAFSLFCIPATTYFDRDSYFSWRPPTNKKHKLAFISLKKTVPKKIQRRQDSKIFKFSPSIKGNNGNGFCDRFNAYHLSSVTYCFCNALCWPRNAKSTTGHEPTRLRRNTVD